MGVLTSFRCAKLLRNLFVTMSNNKGRTDIYIYVFGNATIDLMCDLILITKVQLYSYIENRKSETVQKYIYILD